MRLFIYLSVGTTTLTTALFNAFIFLNIIIKFLQFIVKKLWAYFVEIELLRCHVSRRSIRRWRIGRARITRRARSRVSASSATVKTVFSFELAESARIHWLRVEGQPGRWRRHENVGQFGRYENRRGRYDYRFAPAQTHRVTVDHDALQVLQSLLGVTSSHEGHEATVGISSLVFFGPRPHYLHTRQETKFTESFHQILL